MNKLEQEASNWMKERYKDMKLQDYQEKAAEFAIYPNTHAITYPALGLAGEAGEVANKVKKFIRDGAAQDEYLAKRIEIGYEIGDVLWYCAVLAKEMEMDLGHIMENNLQKLADRKKRGTLSGSGDNR